MTISDQSFHGHAVRLGMPLNDPAQPSQNPPVCNPMLDKQPQPVAVDGTEKPTTIRIEHPIHLRSDNHKRTKYGWYNSYHPNGWLDKMRQIIGILMTMGLMVGVVGCGNETEVVTETQPQTGKLIEEYEVYRDEESNKRIKHGYYKSYYENGRMWKEGNYKSGIKNGKWVEYDENGNTLREGKYKNGKEEGKWV